jgi:PAS domain S-box-containing protein
MRDPRAAGGALCCIAIDVTERRRQEDLLRAEESRYRAMAASLPAALLIAREGRLTYANAAAERMLAVGENESLVGTPLAQLANGTETALVDAAKDLATHDGERHKFPMRLQTRDRRELEVEVSAASYETATERAVQFVVQDVGERNARLRALKDAEAFYHGLCDAAPAALRLVDADGRVSFASRRWEAFVGSVSAGDCLSHVHPDDMGRVRSCYGAPSRRDETTFVEYRLRNGLGMEHWVLDTLLARYDAQGQWRGYLSCCIDISERKLAENALRAHRDDLADLLDRCPAPVWVADAGDVGYANRACVAWLGVESEDRGGVDLASCIHPDDRDDWMRWRNQHKDDGTPFDRVLRVRRFDGEYRHVRIAATPAAGGKRFVGFLDDVSEQRRIAAALAVEEQRRDQIVGLLGAKPGDGLAPLRRTVELVRVMFPNEPRLQQVSATVLSEAERLEGLMDELLEPLRSQREARARG